MNILYFDIRVRLNGNGMFSAVAKDLHLCIGGDQFPAGIFAELLKPLLLVAGAWIKDIRSREVDNRKVDLCGFDSAIEPAGCSTLFQQPTLCCLCFQILLKARAVIEGKRQHSSFGILHRASPILMMRR